MQSKRLLPLAASFLVALGAMALSSGIGVTAQTLGATEGDSYAGYGQGFLLGQGPIKIGPIQASRAVVPPGATQSARHATIDYSSCSGRTSTNTCGKFDQPLIDVLTAAGSTAKATLVTTSLTECAIPGQKNALPANFVGTPLSGGNACSYVAQAGLLNSASSGQASDQIETDDVESQSITQTCVAAPKGFAHIAHLMVGGHDVLGPNGIPVDPAPNTVITVPNVAKIILNEQVFDSQGHGLTVNAIHIFTLSDIGQLANADVIIGHSHSMAICSAAADNANSGLLACPGGKTPCANPVGLKVDSTDHANPGEIVTYTISLNSNKCAVTSVTDTLPPSFHFGSAKGDLGTPTKGTAAGGQEQVFWSKGGQAFPSKPNPLVETVTAKIDGAAKPGQYQNVVTGTSDCGTFAFTDLMSVSGTGSGITVPRPSQGILAAMTNLPNTGLGRGLFAALLMVIGGSALLAAARRPLDMR